MSELELKALEYNVSIFKEDPPVKEETGETREKDRFLLIFQDGEFVDPGDDSCPAAPRPGTPRVIIPHVTPTPKLRTKSSTETDTAVTNAVDALIKKVEDEAKKAIAAEAKKAIAAEAEKAIAEEEAASASVVSPGAATASPDAPSADPPAPVDDDAGKCTIQTPNIEDFDIDDKDKVIDYILKIIENKGENKGENTFNINNIFSECYKYIKEKVKTQDRTSKTKKRKQNIETLRNNITNGSAPIMVNLQKLTNNQYYFELFAYILKYILTLFDYSKNHKYEGNFDPSSQGDRINNFKIFLKMERLKDKTSQCIYSENQSLKKKN